MDRVLALAGRERFSQTLRVIGVSLVPITLLFVKGFRLISVPGSLCLGVVCTSLVLLTLHRIFTRVVVSEEGLTSFNLFNLPKPTVPFNRITLYMPGVAQEWIVIIGKRLQKLPPIDYRDLHPIIVAKAPNALKARRWKTGQLPPRHDFEGLLLFDFRTWIGRLMLDALFTIPIFLFDHAVAVGLFIASVLPLIYDLKDLGGRLNLDSESIAAHWPGYSRRIIWTEVTAIFCEQRGARRSYILTSNETWIPVPAPLLHDREVVRKIFYNLPDGTLCVNFRRNYRTRSRRRRDRRLINLIPVGPRVLEPQMLQRCSRERRDRVTSCARACRFGPTRRNILVQSLKVARLKPGTKTLSVLQ